MCIPHHGGNKVILKRVVIAHNLLEKSLSSQMSVSRVPPCLQGSRAAQKAREERKTRHEQAEGRAQANVTAIHGEPPATSHRGSCSKTKGNQILVSFSVQRGKPAMQKTHRQFPAQNCAKQLWSDPLLETRNSQIGIPAFSLGPRVARGQPFSFSPPFSPSIKDKYSRLGDVERIN